MLIWNWQAILRRAWSVRLMALSGLFTGLELYLPLINELLPVVLEIVPMSKGMFAVLSILSILLGLVARLVDQKGVKA